MSSEATRETSALSTPHSAASSEAGSPRSCSKSVSRQETCTPRRP